METRTGQIANAMRQTVLAMFDQTILSVVTILPVQQADFRMAVSFADRYDLGLRAADALHLAIVANHGATLCTRDRKLAARHRPP
jgi:uncharacterized protein